MQKNAGFTLIELLVVVLIVGILAAIALPQYNVAVAKARYMQAMVLANALRQAQDIYYMANGKYSLDLTNLDISVPTDGCEFVQNNGAISCKDFNCYVYDGWDAAESVGIAYCVLKTRGLYYLANPQDAQKRYCGAHTASADYDVAKKVCLSLGGKYSHILNDVEYYSLP